MSLKHLRITLNYKYPQLLGHGVSYSILSEIDTENTYFIQKQQPDKVILPINTPKEEFTIYVADNIDRNEKALTG